MRNLISHLVRQVNALRIPDCFPQLPLKSEWLLNAESLQLQVSHLWLDDHEPFQRFDTLAFHVANGLFLSSENKVDFLEFDHLFVVLLKTFPAQEAPVTRDVNVFFFGFRVRRVFYHQVTFLQTFEDSFGPLLVQIDGHAVDKLWTLRFRGVTAISWNSLWLFQFQKCSFDQTSYFHQVRLNLIRFHCILRPSRVITDVKHF